jgi:hypothetical protein
MPTAPGHRRRYSSWAISQFQQHVGMTGVIEAAIAGEVFAAQRADINLIAEESELRYAFFNGAVASDLVP